jgi:enoyl-CoA hydratase/carnithine racemase
MPVQRVLDPPVARLVLDDVPRRNALGRTMLDALAAEIAWARAAEEVRVVVLAAAGPVFSAGHDLRELCGAEADAVASLFARCTEVMESLRLLEKPVIAEVAGLATAAGCQLATSCDLVVAAETAAFATPGVRIGLFCSTPAVAVARALPAKKALELLFTGRPMAAAEAERHGLVTRVVPADRLTETTMALAREIASAPPDILALGKRTFYAQAPLDRPAAYAVAQRAMVDNARLPDAQEGMRAFLEKRAPSWAPGRRG